jgi:hypothetical protein
MRRKGGEGGYERRRLRRKDYHSTGNLILEGSLGFAQREESLSSVVGRISTGGTGLLGVLGTGARISIWYPGAR